MSPKFEPSKRPRKSGDPEGNSLLTHRQFASVRVTEKKCHVCQHPQRDYIDMLCAMQVPWLTIENLISTEERRVERRSIANHAREHLSYEDTAVRQILDAQAEASDENLELGVSAAVRRIAVLDIAIQRGLEALARGEVLVEPKDLPKLVELREKLDNNTATAQIDKMQTQFAAFKQAVDEICAPDQKYQILERMKMLLSPEDRPPELEASVVSE